MITRTKSLDQRLSKIVADMRASGRLQPLDSIEWRKLGFEIDRLIGMNPSQGWFFRGAWHALNGNLDDLTRSFANLYQLNQNADALLGVLETYASVGCLKPALPVYNYIANPSLGVLKRALPLAVAMGAIQKTAEYIKKAARENIELNGHEELIDKIQAAAGILEKHGVSDKALSDHMDLAGRVMLAAKRFQTLPNLHLPEGDAEGIQIEYVVDGEPAEVDSLNQALIEKQKTAGIASSPAYTVVFTSAK